MSVTEYAIRHIIVSQWIEPASSKNPSKTKEISFWRRIELLNRLRQWINNLSINNPKVAHQICQAIPAQCPFARKIQFLGRTIVSIPPLCKINPLYDELMMLRFRALSYLADECGEDISAYC